MNDVSKSILAKLLAKENITVRHGNHPTAYFDVENRILGLPLWKEMDKNVYDLFIGHEVSHALETPAEGWHNSTNEIPGCPRAFINIVEDIRIEKLIQRRYPGFVATFKRGYNHLLNEKDFFEIKGKDVSIMSFMNRLNLKSKLRDLIEVKFSTEEQPYVNQAMAVETWDDVIEACRSIYEYLKEKQKDEEKKPSQPKEARDSGTSPEERAEEGGEFPEETSEDFNHAETFDDTVEDSSYKSNSADSGDGQQNSLSSNNVENQQVDQKDGKKEQKTLTARDLFDASTDEAQRRNEETLVERNSWNEIPRVLNSISQSQLNEIIVPFKKIQSSRLEKARRVTGNENAEVNDIFQYFSKDSLEEYRSKYKSFVDETTKLVNVMVKEFEMRKSAFQYSRAKTSRSGALNINKLHEYKFNDDIFRKVTQLADAKSHGMIMLIDHSGSMQNVIGDVILQTLSLVMFCKKVNIPFEVYSFTGTGNGLGRAKCSTNDIAHCGINMCQLISSSLSKSDYEAAYRTLFYQTVERQHIWLCDHFKGYHEAMGSTPSIEVMSAMPIVVKNFKAKHGVQKIIVPFLTDGAPSPVEYIYEKNKDSVKCSSAYNAMIINVNGTYIRAKNGVQMLVKLCQHLRSFGVITLGYYLTDSNQAFKRKIGQAAGSWEKETFAKAYQERRANKFVSFDNTLGFDRYFILKTARSALSTDIEDFSIRDGAKAGEITRAFKKYASSKRTSRIFATQFAEIIS